MAKIKLSKLDALELGNLDVERKFSDVRSVCRKYRLLLESAAAGEIFNVCSGRAYSLRYILDAMAKIAGYEIQVDVNSAFVRENEINHLVGCSQRLHQAIGEQRYPSIEETLRWMYESDTPQ